MVCAASAAVARCWRSRACPRTTPPRRPGRTRATWRSARCSYPASESVARVLALDLLEELEAVTGPGLRLEATAVDRLAGPLADAVDPALQLAERAIDLAD